MTVELETRRLILRPLELGDAARTQALFPHWEIVRYLNAVVPWPYPEDGAHAFYRDVSLPAIERGEEWSWTLRVKGSPSEHIGAISLTKGELDNRGFWLGLPWQGQGFYDRAVGAVNDFWFDVLGFAVLRTPKAAANRASRRISEKTGMRLVGMGEKDFVSGRLAEEVWEVKAEEWRAHRRRLAAEGPSM